MALAINTNQYHSEADAPMTICTPKTAKHIGKEAKSNHEEVCRELGTDLHLVSKDLRTSLSGISMQLEAIEDGMYENNELAVKKLLAKVLDFESKIHAITSLIKA